MSPPNAKSDCPAEHVWTGVAAGLVPNRDAVIWIAHASHCDSCAALLRDAVQDAQVEHIDTPAWRTRMARMMSQASRRPTR